MSDSELDPPPPSEPIPSAPASRARAQGGDRAVRFFTRLTAIQQRHPWRMLALAVISMALCGFLASKLSFKMAFGDLLPQNKESVIIAKSLSKRLPSLSTLTVVIEGHDNEALTEFVDALAPKIRALDPALVQRVDTGAKEARAFFEEKKLLYAKLNVVQEIHDEIEERYNYEVHKGSLLDEGDDDDDDDADEDDDDDAPPAITEESIRKRFEKKQGGDVKKARERFPEYYLDGEKHIIAVLVRTPISSGDLSKSTQLKTQVLEAVASVEKQLGSPGRVGLTGNLITSAETYQQVKNDLAHVGAWGGVLILSIVFLFYLRLRTLVAMTLTVAIGAVWTFGMAYVFIGHLDSSTGFLFSIVVGNGINFGIIYMARYLEARRDQSAHDSALTAHLDTWLSTLTAAAAASAAYGSLIVTDFRGFKHFGIIGGSGMLLCWLGTYLFLPSILAVSEKISPIRPPQGLVAKVSGLYGRPFAFMASRFPGTVILVAAAITAISAYAAYGFIVDPMEFDMSNIGNAPRVKDSDARVLSRKVDKIVGRQGQDGLALVVDRLDQVLPLKKKLEEVRDNADDKHKPFDTVVTIYSLLPSEQKEKLVLIDDTLGLLNNARNKGFIKDEDWKKLEKWLPKEKLSVLAIGDLPKGITASFSEKDGTIGRLVYIVPRSGRSVWDGRYLIEFADSFRRTELPDGSLVKGSGNQVIYADMILTIVEDAPKAIIVSLLATLFIVLLAFRMRGSGFWVIAAVAMGFVWLLAILAVIRGIWEPLDTAWYLAGEGDWTKANEAIDKLRLEPLKLNFLNFVALPITIGVGADYAVNVMQRYRMASGAQVRQVIVETGGAVILCSLTTTLGYFALTLSVNKAIQSFGIAAAAGEVCCVITGVLVLPAALLWLHRRKEAAEPASTETNETAEA